MVDLEIHWPQQLPPEPLTLAVETLRRAGIEPTCRLQPTRRGVAEMSVLVLIGSTALEPLFKSMVDRLADDAYDVIRRLVGGLLGRRAEPQAPHSVVFESTATGTQFVFTSGLPEEAFRQAIGLDPGEEPGRWTWDAGSKRWVRFERSSS